MTNSASRTSSLVESKAIAWVCVALALVTFGVYLPVGGHDFVNYDDYLYVTKNPQIIKGVNPDSIGWALTSTYASNWHPVTWISHMLDCQLFGMKAGAHHLVSVLFHTANVVFLLLVLTLMTGALGRSAMVAGLFALHPTHVESVAWIAERKDVLSACFLLLTLLFYIRYLERPRPWRYAAAMGCFALGLMSKPMLVTLPFVLLLLDIWPLRRATIPFSSPGETGFGKKVPSQKKAKKKTVSPTPLPWRQLILEKWPFFLLSLASSIATLIAQKQGGAVMPLDRLSLSERVGNAIVSYVRYVFKLVWPSHLSVYYPHLEGWAPWQVIGALLLLAAVSFLIFYFARSRPFLLVGWLWFLGMLVPVIGLVQVGGQSMADRYTYVPSIGLFIVFVWGAYDLCRPGYTRDRLLPVAGVALLAVGAFLTFLQLRHWRDSETLFRHALAVSHNNAVAHNNLGVYLTRTERNDEAVEHFRQAIRVEPRHAGARNNLGDLLAGKGKLEEARKLITEALRINPELVEAHFNLGRVLASLGQFSEAESCYQEVLRRQPDHSEVHHELGRALAAQSQAAGAVVALKEAVRRRPNHAKSHFHLGKALAEQNNLTSATNEFHEALRLDESFLDARYHLGVTLNKRGNREDALGHFEAVLKSDPRHAGAHFEMGNHLAGLGEISSALEHFLKAVQADSNHVGAINNLGNIMVSQRNFQEALRYYRQALQLNLDHFNSRHNLARLLTHLRRAGDAVPHYRKLLAQRPDSLEVLNEFARILATDREKSNRDGPEAVRLAERLNALTGGNEPLALDTLAAAYAEVGRFADAIAEERSAIRRLEATGNSNMINEFEARLRFYQENKAYRE